MKKLTDQRLSEIIEFVVSLATINVFFYKPVHSVPDFTEDEIKLINTLLAFYKLGVMVNLSHQNGLQENN